MRIAVVCSAEQFVNIVRRRWPGALINTKDGTATFHGVTLIRVNTPDRVVGYEYDKAWVDEGASVELSALVRTRVRPSAA